jgi:hypothetical protein
MYPLVLDSDHFSVRKSNLTFSKLQLSGTALVANVQTTVGNWSYLLWALLLVGSLNALSFFWRTGSAIVQTFIIPGQSVSLIISRLLRHAHMYPNAIRSSYNSLEQKVPGQVSTDFLIVVSHLHSFTYSLQSSLVPLTA